MMMMVMRMTKALKSFTFNIKRGTIYIDIYELQCYIRGVKELDLSYIIFFFEKSPET